MTRFDLFCLVSTARKPSRWINGTKANRKTLKQKSFMVVQDVNYQLFADSVLNECTLGVKRIDEQAFLFKLYVKDGRYYCKRIERIW